MNHKQIMRKAAKHYDISMSTIAPLADKLRDLLDDQCADIFYQASDGWCFVYGEGNHNTQVCDIDFKKLFSLSKDEALEYLEKYSI